MSAGLIVEILSTATPSTIYNGVTPDPIVEAPRINIVPVSPGAPELLETCKPETSPCNAWNISTG